MAQRLPPERVVLEFGDLPVAVDAETGVADLVAQLEDRVHQHLRPRRAAGQVDVDRHDVVDALHDGVVVEHAAGGRADAHRDHPFRVGHLVVDLPKHRRHLLADPSGDDHQVGLARGVRQLLHAEAAKVVPRTATHHQLDRAAGQAERGRPHRPGPRVLGPLLHRGQQEPGGQVLFQAHRHRPLPFPSRPLHQ